MAHHMVNLDHDGLVLLYRTAKFIAKNFFD
jgi:hypothetical protein